MSDLEFGPGDWVRAEWQGHLFEGEVWEASFVGGLYVGAIRLRGDDGTPNRNVTILSVKRRPRPLPTEPGSVIGWDDGVAVLATVESGYPWRVITSIEDGDFDWFTAEQLVARLAGKDWWPLVKGQ